MGAGIVEEDAILAPVVGAVQQLEALSAQGVERVGYAEMPVLVGATGCIREFTPTARSRDRSTD
jgi:sugar (pentulose or hexulose) kinase